MPMARPRNVATSAPTIPRRVVTMKPPGARPGIRNFATRPTRKPMMIAQMMVMMFPSGIGSLRVPISPFWSIGSVGRPPIPAWEGATLPSPVELASHLCHERLEGDGAMARSPGEHRARACGARRKLSDHDSRFRVRHLQHRAGNHRDAGAGGHVRDDRLI